MKKGVVERLVWGVLLWAWLKGKKRKHLHSFEGSNSNSLFSEGGTTSKVVDMSMKGCRTIKTHTPCLGTLATGRPRMPEVRAVCGHVHDVGLGMKPLSEECGQGLQKVCQPCVFRVCYVAQACSPKYRIRRRNVGRSGKDGFGLPQSWAQVRETVGG